MHRFGYYMGGFAIGLIFLAFFLSGKKTTCDYSPNKRVLKNIRIKERSLSPQTIQTLNAYSMDSTQINYLLLKGRVDFSKSKTHLDSCNIYVIKGKIDKRTLEITVKNCSEKAEILNASIHN